MILGLTNLATANIEQFQHIFLPKNYSHDPYASVFHHHTEAEVLSFLETGWGIGNVEDLQLSFLYGPEDQQ